MALLQISEPGQSTNPHQHRLAIGIDLGTTHSLVATVRSGVSETLPDHESRHLLPSVVHYQSDGQLQVGYDALPHAVEDPENTVISVKRFMGRAFADLSDADKDVYKFVEDDNGILTLRTAGGERSAIHVSADILKVLRERAEVSLGGEIQGAVITVPAYFDDAQRQATKDAAKLAGLSVLRLLNEPTAAAVAYGLDSQAEGVHAVYDLGGGTFDITILQFQAGIFQVLSTSGDTALGGDDFDNKIAEWIVEQAGWQDNQEAGLKREILKTARQAKEQLSSQNEVDVNIDYAAKELTWQGVLTVDKFNTLIKSLVKRTLTICKRALKEAHISAEELEDVVMVGGATRVPLVREEVGRLFKCQPMVDIDPDKVVAIGAATQANVLIGNKAETQAVLLDVTPLSLGIETMGGLVEKVIPRNTPIPTVRAQEFTTYKDGQTAMAVHVLQGEREMAQDCRSLARFELRGIPPMAAGAARIRVTYQMDADGLLNVGAQEMTTGVHSEIVVKPSYGLEDGQIEKALRESLDHAHEDMTLRMLREQQVDARRLLEVIDAALLADGEALLSQQEKDEILQHRKQLATLSEGEDANAIKQAIKALDAASAEFAARRMNAKIKTALTGHKLDEI